MNHHQANELLPCPFCGGAPLKGRRGLDERLAYADEVKISCNRCGVSITAIGDTSKPGYADNSTVEERAIAAWNRRAPAPTSEPGARDGVAAYKIGTWFDARTIDEMQAFYLSRLPAIREAAKEHGYAIGVHGSERRDFDLMAMQWRADASDKDTLARAIAEAACGIRREGAYDWEAKPSGRFAVSIPICWTDHQNPDFDNMISAGHIDLSVIAIPASPAVPADIEQAFADAIAGGLGIVRIDPATMFETVPSPAPVAPVAWAVVSKKGGIHKLAVTRDSAERKASVWQEEWPNNGCTVRPLVFGDAAASPLVDEAQRIVAGKVE